MKCAQSIVSRVMMFVVILLFSSEAAFGATYYVAKTGHDTNNDCTEAQNQSTPKLTINAGIDCMSAGDTLLIKTGTYSEVIGQDGFASYPPSGTSWTTATTISAFQSDTVTVTGAGPVTFFDGAVQYIILQNLHFVNTSGSHNVIMIANGAGHIRITGCEITGGRDTGAISLFEDVSAPLTHGFNEVLNSHIHDNGTDADLHHGIYIHSPNNTISGNDVHDNASAGIHFFNASVDTGAQTVLSNKIYNNRTGLIIWDTTNALVANNFIYANGGPDQGISVNRSPGLKVYNNSISGSAVGVYISNSSGVQTRNNIIVGQSSTAILNGGSGVGVNLCSSGCTINGNPLFVSSTDLHLQSGSPAINQGVTLSEFVTDYDGNGRPQGTAWDLGADEKVLSAPMVTMTAPGNGATVSGASVGVSANATPAAGTSIAGVRFYLDGTAPANALQAEDTTAPYSIVWDSRTVANGAHNLRALARDSNNSTAFSSAIGITVNNGSAPPVISGVTSQGITTTGATIVWTTNTASDSQVDYGTTTAYATGSTTINTSLVTSHSQAISGLTTGVLYHYRVKSRDAAGQLTTSGDFTFTTLDGSAPTVTMTAPADASTVSGAAVPVTANASDNVGVVGVTFKRDGGTVIAAEDTTAPYAITWDSRTVANSSHTLTATARDAQGNTTTSTAVTVTVDNGAQIYFVTKTGNDSNSCTQAKTQGTAKLTIAAGLACMAGGDTLKIGDGTYTETINLGSGTLSGTVNARTTIQALTINGTTPGVILAPSTPTASGDVVTIADTSFLSLKGIDVNAASATGSGVRFLGTSSNNLLEDSHVRSGGAAIDGVLVISSTAVSNIFRRLKVHNVGTTDVHMGIDLRSNGNLIEDSEIYGVTGYAVQVFSDSGTANSNIIRRNKLRNSNGAIAVGASAVNLCVGNQFYNNLVYGNSFGALVYGFGSGSKLWNNTLYGNSLSGIVVEAGHVSIEVVNNIVFQNGTGIQNSGTGTVQNNITSDPLFVDGPGGDFQLTSGSGARDMGQTISALSPATDYLQIVRPVGSAWDVGAYEFVSGADTSAPMVSISSPLNGAAITSGNTIVVSANASDNVAVAGVQFKLDGANLGSEDTSSPYSVSWNTTGVASGAHTLTAVARDTASPANTATSAAINVTIVAAPDTTNPLVSITAPAPGASVSGTTVQVTANASDNVGVVGVQFKVDGANVQAEDTTAPYGIIWNSTTVANGTRNLTATARDAAGNTTTSGQVGVNVNNVGPDTQAPTVTMTAPSPGTVIGTITLSANASDDVGVVGVAFRVDGAQIGGEDLAAPYSISWNSAGIADGAHTLTARARDAVGNAMVSDGIAITVSNSAPIISGVSVSGITTTAATINWTTSTSADSRVDYGFTGSYGSYTTLGTFATSHSIPLTGLTAFTLYHYQVSSTDSLGRLATSGDFTFTTAASGTPSITVTEPTSSSVWTIGATVPINWTSANVTGSARVRITRNGGNTFKTIINSVPVSNGTVNWVVTNPTTAGAGICVESITNPSIRGCSDSFRIQK